MGVVRRMNSITEIHIYKVENGYIVKCFIWSEEKDEYLNAKSYIADSKQEALVFIKEHLDTKFEEEIKY